MTRKEFLKICGILGIGMPMYSTLASCKDDDSTDGNFSGKVIIIGAGAGGLSAGYLLQQQGIEFEILEASGIYGGRLKISTDFADFPIPLGAEWLHTNTNAFQTIVNDGSVNVNVNTINYNSQDSTYAEWDNGNIDVEPLVDSDIKFVNTSWLQFYETYIIPSVADKISYNSVVESIDYSGDQININTSNGMHTCDKVVISVPLKILQDGDINFSPNLPSEKLNAINDLTIWEGFKAFFEFSDKFYDTQIGFPVNPETDGQKLFYDAAYGQNSSQHILGVFTVGKPALDYATLSDEVLRETILDELDEIYNNQATPNYIKHLSQNWNNEPYIKAGYVTDHANWNTVSKLSNSVGDKIYFSGAAYTDGNDWVSVQNAAASARNAVNEILS